MRPIKPDDLPPHIQEQIRKKTAKEEPTKEQKEAFVEDFLNIITGCKGKATLVEPKPKQPKQKKLRKGAVKAFGYTFKNKAEYTRHIELMAMQENGEIRNLRYESIKFLIIDETVTTGRASWYTPDWTYEMLEVAHIHSNPYLILIQPYIVRTEDRWIKVAEDWKGFIRPEWKYKAGNFTKAFPEWRLIQTGKGRTLEVRK